MLAGRRARAALGLRLVSPSLLLCCARTHAPSIIIVVTIQQGGGKAASQLGAPLPLGSGGARTRASCGKAPPPPQKKGRSRPF